MSPTWEESTRAVVGRWHPVAVVAGLLVVVQLVVRATWSAQGWWWQDDFLHLSFMRHRDLAWDTLVRDYNDHLEVLPNLFYWLVSRGQGAPFAWGVGVLIGLQAVASVLMILVLRAVCGLRPVLLVVLAAYLFTPLAGVPLTWVAAGLEALALQVSLLGTLWCSLQWWRGKGRWWLVASLALHAFGLLSWEKALVVWPTVAAIVMVVEWNGRPIRARLGRLLAHPLWWAPHIVLMAVFVGVYVRTVDGSERSAVVGADYGEAVLDSVVRVLLPGLYGGPWTARGAENTLFPAAHWVVLAVVAVVSAALLAVVVLRGGTGATAAVALALAYVAGDVFLLLWGRGGYLLLVARDPRYVADAVPVIAVLMAAAWCMRRGGGPESPSRLEPADAPRGWTVLAPASGLVVALVASGLHTGVLLAPNLRHPFAHDYVRALSRGLQDQPGATVVDTELPPEISGRGTTATILRAVGRRDRLGVPGPDAVMPDGFGSLVPVQLISPSRRTGPQEDCGWRVGGASRRLGFLPRREASATVLNVGVVSGHLGTLEVSVDGDIQVTSVSTGPQNVWFVTGDRGGEIRARFRPVPDAGEDAGGAPVVCVSDFAVGTPWPRQ